MSLSQAKGHAFRRAASLVDFVERSFDCGEADVVVLALELAAGPLQHDCAAEADCEAGEGQRIRLIDGNFQRRTSCRFHQGARILVELGRAPGQRAAWHWAETGVEVVLARIDPSQGHGVDPKRTGQTGAGGAPVGR